MLLIVDLALLESAFLLIMGANLMVLGGVFLLSQGMIDRISAALVLVAGVYAVLWQEPVVLGAAAERLLPIEIAKNGFLVSISGAVFLWAYWLYQRHIELLEATRDDLERAVVEGQIYIDVLGHDIRNPLTVAMSSLELAGRKHPPAKPDLEPAEDSLDRIEDLIHRSLLFSRLEHTDDVDHPEVSLQALISETVEGLVPLAASRGVGLEVELGPIAPYGASPLFGQAVENLVSNAIRWSPRGEPVELIGEDGPASWKLKIRDHGPGIPIEEIEEVFGRFEQGRVGTPEGHGLGLAIAHRIMDIHHGSISIEETPGGGATFVLTVPKDLGDGLSNKPRATGSPAGKSRPQGGAT